MSQRKTTLMLAMLSIVILLVSPVSGQKTDIKVDGQDVRDLVTHMSTDNQLGRKPLTPEFFKLHEWAANKFKAWGLEPGGDDGSFFQAVPITGRRGTYSFNRGMPKLMINGREFFTKFGDFSIDSRSTTGKKIRGELVFVGYGISAPDKDLDEYANIDVRGKFVFVFKGSPNDARPARGFFSMGGSRSESETSEDWKAESQDSTKIKIAYEKGAAGILFYNPDPDSDPFARYRSAPVEKSFFTRDFIVVSNTNERIYQWIFWRDPQESSRGFERRMSQMRLEIKDKKSQSFATGIRAEITGFTKTTLYGEKFDNYKCRNVVAKLSGTDPMLRDECIVLGGHFDHLGLRNSQVYNGADDNASGSAVVMEVARMMKQANVKPKRTVYFCLWTGEELGLIGSRYWAKNPTDGVTMDKVVTNFNMDMVGLGDQIGAPGALNFPSIWEVIKKHQDEDIMEAVNASEGGPGGSDHSAFIELGIESMALMTRGGGGHPDYHDTGDDPEKMDKEILRKTAQFVLQGTMNLANESGSLVIKDRQHIYDGMRWNIATINPGIKVSGRWTVVDAKSKDDLTGLILDKVQEMKKPARPSPMRRFRRGMPRGKFNQGLSGPQVFNHDINDMLVAYTILGFGRIDVKGDDGKWLSKGLTDCGRRALAAMEDSSIVLNLVNPPKESFSDVLSSAKKSFLVSGMTHFDTDQISMMNEKNVLVAVDFDPEDVESSVSRLEDLKTRFGDRDNLILNLTSRKSLKEGKKALYRQLIERGWTKKEIYAIGGAGTSRGSLGNLSKLGK